MVQYSLQGPWETQSKSGQTISKFIHTYTYLRKNYLLHKIYYYSKTYSRPILFINLKNLTGGNGLVRASAI